MQSLVLCVQNISLDQQWIDAKFSPAQNTVYGEAPFPITETVAYQAPYPD